MKSLLIAMPVKPGLHPYLVRHGRELLDDMMAHPRNTELFAMETAVWEDPGAETPPNAPKFYHQARARNELLAAHLKPSHDYVLWIDADMVFYPPDLPAMLYEANPDGVTAPAVLIEGGSLFYDTLGFVLDGGRISAQPPYFPDTDGPLVDLDSVGCIYLIPAQLLRDVAYASLPYNPAEDNRSIADTGHTDHWPVMKAARERGMRVACLRTAVSYHAYLPKYGEMWH